MSETNLLVPEILEKFENINNHLYFSKIAKNFNHKNFTDTFLPGT